MQFADPDSLPATDSTARLQAAVAMLPEAQRALLRAAFYDGMPICNIAEREGVSQPAITQRLKTIKKKLKEILSDPYI